MSFKQRLGVNVDHVATVRNARGTPTPDPLRAALLAAEAGADGITAHLREVSQGTVAQILVLGFFGCADSGSHPCPPVCSGSIIRGSSLTSVLVITPFSRAAA